MTKQRMMAAVLGATVALGVGAFAQDAASNIAAGKRWLILMNHKGDRDDTISRDEFNRYMDQQFRIADADHDGTLDVQELGHLHNQLSGK